MDKSKVFFTNLHTTPSSNLLDKMERLIKRAGIESIDFKDQFVAIKIHFGEPGNTFKWGVLQGSENWIGISRCRYSYLNDSLQRS